MVMDFLRTFYTTDMRVSVDPPQIVRVRWYAAPEGAKVLPTGHAFGNGPGLETGARDYPHADLGQFELTRKHDRGLTPAGVTGQETPTPLEWYRQGVPAEALDDPPPAECVMEVDLCDDQVELCPTTTITVSGPGNTPINGPGGITINAPLTISSVVTIGGPVTIIAGPGGTLIIDIDVTFNIVTVTTITVTTITVTTITVTGILNLTGGVTIPTSAPGSPVNGSMYINTTTCELNIYCGGAWRVFSPLGGTAAAPTSQPGSPSAGYFSWDPTQGQLSCFGDGGWWVQSFLPPPP